MCMRTPVREDEAHDEERVMADRTVDRFHDQVCQLCNGCDDPWHHAVSRQTAICADQPNHIHRLSRGENSYADRQRALRLGMFAVEQRQGPPNDWLT